MKQKQHIGAILDKLAGEDAFFPVETRPIQTIDGQLIGNKVATIRSDTGEPLGVVSPTYKVVSNEQAFSAFTRALAEIDVDLEGAVPMVDFSHGGAKTMVQLVIPSMTWDEPGGRGKTAFRMILKNSYDGSWKLEAFGGGLRGACMNGQVFGNYMTRYASRHVRSLSIEAASEKIAMAFNMWDQNKELWDQMHNVRCSDNDAFTICALYAEQPKLAKHGLEVVRQQELPIGRILDNTFSQWQRESKDMGRTVWSLYNALTHEASHNDSGYDDMRASGLARREANVAKVIECQEFKRLLAA